MIQRFLLTELLEKLNHSSKIILIYGARQVGKTNLLWIAFYWWSPTNPRHRYQPQNLTRCPARIEKYCHGLLIFWISQPHPRTASTISIHLIFVRMRGNFGRTFSLLNALKTMRTNDDLSTPTFGAPTQGQNWTILKKPMANWQVLSLNFLIRQQNRLNLGWKPIPIPTLSV